MHFFFFNDTATTEIYTLSLHDALPISMPAAAATAFTGHEGWSARARRASSGRRQPSLRPGIAKNFMKRSEEHTSELQSRQYLVCRLLLEKKKIEVKKTTIS